MIHWTLRIVRLFITAFFLNALWEYAHSFLYVQYRGGAITGSVLVHAALFDAVVIVILGVPFLSVSFFRRRLWLIIPSGMCIAVALEWYALGTGRWVYASTMPIIPFLHTGLTPTIQLGFLGYMALRWYDICMTKKTLLGIIALFSLVLFAYIVWIPLCGDCRAVGQDGAIGRVRALPEVQAFAKTLGAVGREPQFYAQDEGEYWLVQVLEVVADEGEAGHTATFGWYRVEKKGGGVGKE